MAQEELVRHSHMSARTCVYTRGRAPTSHGTMKGADACPREETIRSTTRPSAFHFLAAPPHQAVFVVSPSLPPPRYGRAPVDLVRVLHTSLPSVLPVLRRSDCASWEWRGGLVSTRVLPRLSRT